MQKITPHLWFNDQAEEAANFYVSVFKNSKILNVSHYGEAGSEVSGQPKGSVMLVEFQIEGQNFMALNGGPVFTFNESISFVVSCETQEEIDELWSKLSAVPEAEQCGWLKDKYGVSWQIVPADMHEVMNGSDPVRAERAMAAVLKMKKLDINQIRAAAGLSE